MIRVSNISEAWELARALTGEDFELNKYSSENAGYRIYTSIDAESLTYVSDLGERLEINFEGGKSRNIWIEEVGKKMMPAKVRLVSITDGHTTILKSFEDFTDAVKFAQELNSTFQNAHITSQKAEVIV